MDNEEENILNRIKRHKLFVSENENMAINGLPDKIERNDRFGDDMAVERNVKELGRVAENHNDYELKRMVRSLKEARERRSADDAEGDDDRGY